MNFNSSSKAQELELNTAKLALTLGLSPKGRIIAAVGESVAEDLESEQLSPTCVREIAEAFAKSTVEGILHLANARVDGTLGPVCNYWQDFGRRFMNRLCAIAELEGKRGLI